MYIKNISKYSLALAFVLIPYLVSAQAECDECVVIIAELTVEMVSHPTEITRFLETEFCANANYTDPTNQTACNDVALNHFNPEWVRTKEYHNMWAKTLKLKLK